MTGKHDSEAFRVPGAPQRPGGRGTGGRGTLAAAIGTAALAGLLFGFDTAVIAGVTGDLTHLFALTPETLGITVSAALWGTLVGALFAGKPGDAFGSRDSLRILAAFYFIAGIGCALASSWPAFLIFRFMCGLAIGGSSVLAPVYIAEIAPPRHRGFLVGLFQLMIVTGILVAYLSNATIAGLVGGDAAWRWKLGVTAAPALLFFVLLFAIPNSPRWLVSKGRRDEAGIALTRIGTAPDAAEAELRRVEQALERDPPGEKLSWRRHRRPMMLVILVAMFNQLAGINAVLYYLNDIFARAGSLSPDRQAVLIGIANLVFTLVGMALIDRIGRKTLLLAGAAGMTLCLAAAAGVLYGALDNGLMLPALIGFIAFFATSQGAVIWVYISEIFPTPVRARGSALGASTHWLMNALIAGIFPILVAWSPGAPFAIFAAAMVVQFVVVAAIFPETRGVDLDEMAERIE
ncbi:MULTISPECIES: sugar porter family MFS transporter [unclassified Sphingopyxis]|uniref:sugar porter family MFS transporter n=1 Tax=unclassified Sphingopyxis TaxID=2614943 RepID=UPI002857FC8B|nr:MULTISPECIES: sugar porter family MFS transporter [unclassified Sphingopyxis]MDR7058825.1 sugar porter (SP) family MFS transporter [Sphingopyxis sp. BE235]MDR7178989.1 sugar porter (SP) family MFS transporter [Sphingopyxis sp. BE249]